MKNVILTILFFCFFGAAQAYLLSNGDFNLPGTYTANPGDPATLGDPATDWEAWSWGGGWSNTETAAWGSPGGTFHQAVGAAGNGGGGVYQLIPVTAGQSYTLTTDSGADAWWLPTGTMAMIWLRNDLQDLLDPNNIVSEDIRNTVDPVVYGQNYDIPHPWENYSLTATAPAGAFFVKVELAANNATGSVGFDNASFVLDGNPYPPYDPDPANGEEDVLVNATLSWHISDPNGTLVSHKLYMSDGTTDPNLFYVDTIVGWDGGTLRASYTPVANLILDGRYLWRVDKVLDDTTEVVGPTWMFYTQPASPIIMAQPAPYTLVDAGDPLTLSVTVNSASTAHYQWYKVVDGSPDTTVGTDSDQYEITSITLAEEGSYYCEITNDATLPIGIEPAVVSNMAVVGIKREIAHWSFTGGSKDATNDEGQTITTMTVGDPVTAAGILGDGMVFDADTGAEDMLYTEPNATFFDICNYNMTVGCWIKSDSNDVPDWSPLVARNGEEDGWQLRRGNTGHLGDQRVVFSTRGLAAVSGGNDGTASLDTAFDEQWHYVVATYDGSSRKVYVDGVVQKVWWIADGLPQSAEGDDATGTITPSASGVSIAGRYGQNPAGVDDQFIAGTYDEVEIWNYARSAAEIAQTYASMTNTAVCPVGTAPAYDLDGDCIVDLNDFVKLASEWLTDTSVQP